MNKDTLQVVISDMHSGSNYALFLGREWHGRSTSHIPRSNQIAIRAHWLNFAEAVKVARKGKRVRLIHNGDAIDGDHHHSSDVCSTNELEQADIHVELIEELKKKIGWECGDELYYTRGTQTHTHEMEEYIGRETNAVMNGAFYCHDLLRLETNGVRSWFVHHGKGAGKGANEGNAIRNWLKDIYFDAMKRGTPHPHIVYSGHVHTPTYSSYVYNDRFNYGAMHGVISPSWQNKTRFSEMVAGVEFNAIGGVIHEIKADGTISVPRFVIMGAK